MKEYKIIKGRMAYIASSISDFLSVKSQLSNGTPIVFTTVSLRQFGDLENHPVMGIGYWYTVSDPISEIKMFWPMMWWSLKGNGLTPEMRQCGCFFAAALVTCYGSKVDTLAIHTVLNQRSPEKPAKAGLRSWLGKLVPAFAESR